MTKQIRTIINRFLYSVFNRIIEIIVYNRLLRFSDENKILNSKQYGFRKAHSTTHTRRSIKYTG